MTRTLSLARRWTAPWCPPILLSWCRRSKDRFSRAKETRGVDRFLAQNKVVRINLCCGPVRLPGYVNVDVDPSADVVLDLEKDLLPFPDGCAEAVVCMSAINYFTRERALEIIRDVHRVLQPGAIARFGVQDLRILAAKYLDRDSEFFFQRLPGGRVRFPGETFADKLNAWFWGQHKGLGYLGKYAYDFESLRLLFERAGFVEIENRKYCESSLEDVAQIDNRPEQMFFLECRKGSVAYFREKAISLWHVGQKEKGWQSLLHALEQCPGDRPSVEIALEAIHDGRRPEDAVKLIDSYLKAVPHDGDMTGRQGAVVAGIQESALGLEEIRARQRELDGLNARRNAILPDKEHLLACMRWFRHARTVSADAGVPVLYDMVQRRWGISFPETTGYIIPTFLCCSKVLGDADCLKAAIDMGDWEVAIQAVSGAAGEPVGGYHFPRVFNTGQVMLGWVALYRQTGEQRYLRAAEDAAHFLVRHLDPEGRWIRYSFLGSPRCYYVRVAWALLELYAVTGYSPYRRAAELSVRWVLEQACSNGWFRMNSMSSEDRTAGTHPIGYALVGLVETLRLHTASCDDGKILRLLTAAADNLVRTYIRERESRASPPYKGLPAYFNSKWRSWSQWSCVTGNAQISFFLSRLASYAPKSDYSVVAKAILDDVKTLHLVDGVNDPNILGGLCGSDPVGGAYCPYAMPNWGVKFFADCLLQRLAPQDDMVCLG
jgi:predicted SAM-dependent methyltransferase